MRLTNSIRISVLSLVMALCSARASAQQPTQDPDKEAERLFELASGEMDKGQFATACPKLEQSTKLVPDAGGAQILLAECYEKTGKLASAWRRYRIVRDLPVVPDKAYRQTTAASKLAEIEPKLARLTLHMPPDLRALDGLTMELDGVLLAQNEWDKTIPVDKGEHTIELSAIGYKSRTLTLSIAADGLVPRLDLPMLTTSETQAVSPMPSSSPLAAPGASLPTSPPAAERSKAPGFVIGGVGLAAAVAGGALMGIALGVPEDIRSKQSNPPCRRDPQPGEAAVCTDLRAQAQSGSAIGNAGIGLVAGGGVLLVAGVLWLAIPSKKAAGTKASHVLPVIGRDGGGLVLTGSF